MHAFEDNCVKKHMYKYSQNLDILDIKIYNFSLKDNTAKNFFLPNKLLMNK